jgi:hypothetical protein
MTDPESAAEHALHAVANGALHGAGELAAKAAFEAAHHADPDTVSTVLDAVGHVIADLFGSFLGS